MEKILAPLLYDILLGIGSFWFAFMVYFLLSVLLIDFARLIFLIFHFMPAVINQNYILAKQITALIVVVVVSIVVLAGYINTQILSVKTLNLDLRKGSNNLNELNAVMISDIHLSPINNGRHLRKIVQKINELNPDIILIAGDLVDDKAETLRNRDIGSSLLDLKSKFGTYAIIGNHEFINGVEGCEKYIRDFGITLLRDSSIKIDNSFFLVGRDDRAIKQFTKQDRKPLEELMKDVDKSLPIILMDHTPFGLDEAEKNNIDLQLSGHTHHGQMFPANLITKMVYELSWGYLKKGNTQYYVSCGAGTWGPPVKIGSPSEIVNLKIKFI
ncbi:MAG: metallophosphoesterase [Bacteroidetes bacterium]|nr:metallophosphoesterase [Bacteroidota bacterium]